MLEREMHFMEMTIALARQGMDEGMGGPFGAIVVKGDEIIGQSCNKVTSTNDPTAHAEVLAIREACRKIGSFQLSGCEIYTSCEPCPMCLGAIYWARPDRVYYAGTREDAAAICFDDSLIYDEIMKPPASRRIPMQQIGHAAAWKVFEAWRNKEDKISY
jgi:tRNA(Arg) A34 adenosine deaminase TadA